jgi:hypothetical protein
MQSDYRACFWAFCALQVCEKEVMSFPDSKYGRGLLVRCRVELRSNAVAGHRSRDRNGEGRCDGPVQVIEKE